MVLMELRAVASFATRNSNGGIPTPGWVIAVLFVLALIVIGVNFLRRK